MTRSEAEQLISAALSSFIDDFTLAQKSKGPDYTVQYHLDSMHNKWQDIARNAMAYSGLDIDDDPVVEEEEEEEDPIDVDGIVTDVATGRLK